MESDSADYRDGDSEADGKDDESTDVDELILTIIELEEDLDRSLGRIKGDEEIERRFQLLDAWVAGTSWGLTSLQSEYPIRGSLHTIRAILDIKGRRERAASRHNDALAEFAAARDSGKISAEWANRMLERLTESGPVDLIPTGMPSELEILRRKLVLHLASERIRALPEVAAKAIELMPLVIEVKLPDSVAKYLARVAANFIEGRHIEGVILARAVLDAAMKDLMRDAEVHRCLPEPKPASEIDLRDRTVAAERWGRLSKATASVAKMIRIRGNDAVHVNESRRDGFVGDFDYVRALAAVLQELYGERAST